MAHTHVQRSAICQLDIQERDGGALSPGGEGSPRQRAEHRRPSATSGQSAIRPPLPLAVVRPLTDQMVPTGT